jgi:hypothetical protein
MISSRNKGLLLIILVLLLSNLALVGYLVFGKQERKPKRTEGQNRGEVFLNYVIKEVNFSDEQAAKFKQMMTDHIERMRPIMMEVRKAKDSMFSYMRQPTAPSDSVLQTLADNIAQKQKFQELQSFNHFRQVRELCTEEQKPKFDTVIRKMINRSFGRGQDRGKRNGDKTP